MKKNIGNLIIVAFFVVALVLFFLAGVKGSPLNTLGVRKEETAETTRRTAASEQPSEGMVRQPDGQVRTRDGRLVTLNDSYVRNILMKMSLYGMSEYIENGIRIFIDDGNTPHLEEYAEPPHKVPTEYDYPDEVLLADLPWLVSLMQQEILDGCHFEGQNKVSFGGELIRKVGEDRYLAVDIGLKRCEVCGRLLAFPARKGYFGKTGTMINGVVRYTGPVYETATHVHSYEGPLGAEPQNVECGAGSCWEGTGILYDAGNLPDSKQVTGYDTDHQFMLEPFGTDVGEYRLFITYNPDGITATDEEWDAILHYVKLWLKAQDPAEYFEDMSAGTP